MAGYVVASDLGSSGCKTLVVDQRGAVVAGASHEYRSHYRAQGWCEQDPQDWVRAAISTTRAAIERSGIGAGEVLAYGVVGVTHNAVLLDADGLPLRRSILLFDTRSQAECEELEARWGAQVFRRTWNAVTPAWTWPQLLWLRRNEPETWKRLRTILFQKDYVRHVLAPSPVTDTIDAGGSLLYDPVRECWIDSFVDDLGLDPGCLPRAVAPTHIVGRLSAAAADAMGLRTDTPVIAGTTDTAAEVLGAGAVRPGQGTVKLASVGRVTCVCERPLDHPMGLNYRHVLDGLWYPGTATKHASTAYRWLRDACDPQVGFEELSAEADGVPLGAAGLLFQPHLSGEWAPYWDARLRGSVLGLTMAHGRGHLARAVMEGVGFALRAAIEFAESAGLEFRELRLLGGGSVSPLWAQALTDILGRPLLVPAERDAAYGAALVTGMGAGLFPVDAPGLASLIRITEERRPDPEAQERYDELYGIYRDAEDALRDISHRLSAFASHHEQACR